VQKQLQKENSSETNLEQAQEQEFRGDNIRVLLSKKPGCHAHITAFVEPIAVKAAYEKALKNVGKEVSIPGFRKGKAPQDILVKNYASYIEREWKDICLQTAFQEVMQLTNLKPLSKNSIKRSHLKKCSKEEGAEAIFDYEYEPDAPLIDINSLKSHSISPQPITDKELAWELKKLKVMDAKFEEVTDRPVQDDDFIEMDLDVVENPAHNVFTNQLFSVTKNEMPNWGYPAVLGMNLNESKEVTITPETPGHVHDESCKHDHDHAESKLCRITIKTIKKANLPEENEDFAKKFGFSSLDELKVRVKGNLQVQAANFASEETRTLLCNELLSRYPIDLPQALIDNEVNARFHYEKSASDKEKGALPLTTEQEQQAKADIEREVRAFYNCMFLLKKVAPQAQATVTQDELKNEINVEMYSTPPRERLVHPGMEPEDARNRLAMKIIMRKCMNYVIQKCDERAKQAK
jgi:trigger factor